MLNSRSFNIMKALEEAETFEINKKITVDSYHESLIESAKMNEDSVGNKTFTDSDEAEYYRNKELYANSGLARHKEAMEKAKEACDKKGIKVNTEDGIYESNIEDDKTSKEERLASLKTQLEQDGDQLSDDEKEAIQAEINELENEEPSMNESVTIDEISKIRSEIDEANSLKEIQDAIDKISDESLQHQVQITFDQYDKADNEDMNESLDEVKNEVIQTLEDNAEYDEESLTEASTPNVEKFIYDLDVDSGNAWSVNYNDRKRGVEVYKNGKSEKTVDDIIKAVTSKYPQLKVSMKGKNTVLFKYDDKSLKEDNNLNEDAVGTSQEFFGHSLEDDIDEYEGPVSFDRFLQRAIDFGVEDEAFEKYGNRSRTSVNKLVREYYKDYKAKMNQAIKDTNLKEMKSNIDEAETPEAMQAIADKQMPKGGYRYMARHAIGPGTLPDDIKVFKTEDIDNGKIAMYISRPLTSEELKKYDIDPEWIQESAVPKLADYQNAFNDDFNKIYNIGTYEDGMGDLDIYKNNKRVGSIYRNDDNKYEVTLRKHFKEKVADTWQDAVKLLNDVASEEVSAQDLTEEATMKRYKVSFYVDTDTMNNMDIEEKVAEILAGSGLASTDETIDVENITDLTEADNITETKVSDLKNIKSQGNIYMLQDNKRFIVGENYDEAQGLIENAEIYDNKDDADKDYLDRCDITKDGKKVQLNGQDDIDEE